MVVAMVSSGDRRGESGATPTGDGRTISVEGPSGPARGGYLVAFLTAELAWLVALLTALLALLMSFCVFFGRAFSA
jgi:hypothetical protein